jgi:nitric oxide synthase-interacting protein
VNVPGVPAKLTPNDVHFLQACISQLACDFSINAVAISFGNYNTEYSLHHLCLYSTLIAIAKPVATSQPWHTVIHPPILLQNHQIYTDPPGKRNTSLAFFTAHERNELKSSWGSRSTRLTRDSFLPFGSCQLCLLPSRDPVSCPSHGHLFCRECAISNLLAQSKELKRLKKEAEQRRLEDSEEKEIEDAEAQARAVEEFERVQAGLSVRSGGKIVGRKDGKVTVEQDGEKGVKRKLELDEAELKDLADGSKSRKKGDISSQELPAFWVPGKIPAAQKAELKAPKLHPTCPAAAADKPHDISLKSLVNVRFTEASEGKETANSDSSSTPTRTCPSCNKTLSNATKAVLAKPCGHVLCKPCSDKFQRAAEKSAHDKVHDEAVRCYVCQEDVTPSAAKKKDGDEKKKDKKDKIEKGLVELCSDGTGFASGGTNMVKRQGVAFQC